MTGRGILLDIEGTTTPISFVYEVLFPFARQHAAEYLKQADLADLKREYDEDVGQGRNPPPWSAEPVGYVHWLMDQDRKTTALKDLQGRIWLRGYHRGDLRGQVFPDVPVRQWVLSLPHRLRYLLAWDHELCRAVTGVAVQTVRAWEQGDNIPCDMPCRFLDEINANPTYWQRRLRDAAVSQQV